MANYNNLKRAHGGIVIGDYVTPQHDKEVIDLEADNQGSKVVEDAIFVSPSILGYVPPQAEASFSYTTLVPSLATLFNGTRCLTSFCHEDFRYKESVEPFVEPSALIPLLGHHEGAAGGSSTLDLRTTYTNSPQNNNNNNNSSRRAGHYVRTIGISVMLTLDFTMMLTSVDWCIRDSSGQFVMACTSWLQGRFSIIEDEAIALMEAMKEVKRLCKCHL
ncbi:hypothetical protein L195_g021860 [Trifolium pratense]|uniref:RNase H type-1 domain-containing protein n=1 Tax=Trifolium pratense TaxID=57577 RepID=A0A2K3N6G4_TRIPR|nr:hypothetical protein L195_g021860 [Trifolium pratense]